jgi:primosomal protein N' (replication factor Y)
MINRRGFAPWLTCRSCGHHWSCPNCDVSLIVHRESGRLVCHHCAHVERAPRACPVCSSTTLARAGAGTERIEELVRERLAPMPVFRLDSDTTSQRGAHARILAEFGEAPSAVLVGTQMVAKGHDFPEVTLSAILDADATLRFPDFRAEERTFAMVAQLAGRSGRGEAGGEVMVQTLAPGASSIEHAAAAAIASELRSRLPAESELLGPAPMFRVRGRHRRRILVKAQDRAGTVAAAGATVERHAVDRALKDVSIGVDVDPT